MKNNIDLFQFTEKLPLKIQKILNDFNGRDCNYKNCKKLLNKLNKHSYTFDFGLDGIPHNLTTTK